MTEKLAPPVRSSGICAALLTWLIQLAPPAEAAIEHDFALGLQMTGADITSSNIVLKWEVANVAGDIISGKLLATGKSTVMDLDGIAPPDFRIFPSFALGPPGGNFRIEIDVEIDTASRTIQATAGTLEVEGFLGDSRQAGAPKLIAGSGTLLTGEIADFGFLGDPTMAGVGKFEFVFTPTGGDLANSHTAFGNTTLFPSAIATNIISTTLRNYEIPNEFIFLNLDSFQANFQNGSSTSDMASMVVPEPPSFPIVLGLLSLLVFFSGRTFAHHVTRPAGCHK